MNDAVIEAVKARQPIYPPEQSMGGINSYNFGCKVAGYSPGYCVCLHKIAAYKRDGDLTSYPECGKAIRNDDCPAKVMQAEEVAAGKALYFIDRALLREEMDKAFAISTPSFRSTKVAAAKPAPVQATAAKDVVNRLTTMPTPEIDGYAAAINAAIAATPAEPATPPKEEPKVVVPSPSVAKPPSLVDMVRMQMGKPSGT